jgi:hypothetical protein
MMRKILRTALIATALIASASAVVAVDGDANPVPNNATIPGMYSDAAPSASPLLPSRPIRQ